jgi:NAD(P)-dependent dehydrogenase (short-subunit alcohol dehydrogenase family)
LCDGTRPPPRARTEIAQLDLADAPGSARVLDVNLTGTFAVAQAAAGRMAAGGRGGRIVNVTSVHEHVPLGQAAAYCSWSTAGCC